MTGRALRGEFNAPCQKTNSMHYSDFTQPGSHPFPPAQPTEFERETIRLGLVTEDQQKKSHSLKSWATRHRNNRFVPEELLKHWRLNVYDATGRYGSTEDE
jgi:hypothetical protein